MKLFKEVHVREVMEKKPLTVHPKDKVEDFRKTMSSDGPHHAMVVVMGSLKGIISLGDVLFREKLWAEGERMVFPPKIYSTILAEDVMTERPLVIHPDATLYEGIGLFAEHSINALPVVKNDEVVGLLTAVSVFKWITLNA